MKKIDSSLVIEILGVGLVATGLALLSVPVALVAVGSFLIWATEKAG